jgi:hypothetical protein
MKTQRRNLFIKTATWLIAEVILNLVGLDNLADYSEFVFDQNLAASIDRPVIATTLVFDQFNLPQVLS